MNLSEIKTLLPNLGPLTFLLPGGASVPAHFHITEVGQVHKRFIDCGGTVREEKLINFQLWEDGDYDHRLGAKKLLDIIQLSERILGLEDLQIEVEYQGDTIGKYSLEFNGQAFVLNKTMTDCLAKEKCGIPEQKPSVNLAKISETATTCAPGSGCC